jgi:hypothetical protein
VVTLISGSSEEQTQDSILKSIQSAAAVDPIMLELRDVIMKGFPNDKCNLFPTLRPFWDVRKQLAIDEEEDMLVMGARVVKPRSQVQRVINTLLSLHQGASKMRQRAQISVYWPGMDAEIANAASQCEECTDYHHSKKRQCGTTNR